MKTVSKSVLKAQMLEFFREIEATGEDLIVTSNGVPVLKVSPIRRSRSTEQVFEDVRGKVEYRGDLLEDTNAEWPET